MKSLFLVVLAFMALDWPKSSVGWPMQGYSEYNSPLSSRYGQYGQGYGSRANMMGGSNFKLNPELMRAAAADKKFGNTDQRAAFSRTAANAKAKKLSNARFLNKPTETDQEQIERIEQLPKQQQESGVVGLVQEAAATKQELDTLQQQQQQPRQQQTEAATLIPKEVEVTLEELPIEQIASEIKETPIEAAAPTKAIEEAPKEAAAPAPAAIESINFDQLQAEAKHNQEAALTAPQQEQQQQADTFHPKYLSKSSEANRESVRTLNMRRPAPNHEFFRSITQQQQQDFESQHQRLYDQQQQQHQEQQLADQEHIDEELHVVQDAPAFESSNLNTDEIRFKFAKPDQVNSVGMDTVRSEAAKVLAQRKSQQQASGSQTAETVNLKYGGGTDYAKKLNYGKNFGTGDVKRLLNGYDILPGRSFSSLIIIANTNTNANLGVSSLDANLLKSFLALYVNKNVNDVLNDPNFLSTLEAFNKANNYSSTDSSYSGSKPYESTSKLSANVPAYLSQAKDEAANPSNSHSESTIMLKKTESSAESVKNLNYRPNGGYNNPNAYSYVPYQNGGVIVINNVNDNLNNRVRSVLSGEGYNTSGYNAGLVLPLPKAEIERLMEDAIIVNNDNRNKNKY